MVDLFDSLDLTLPGLEPVSEALGRGDRTAAAACLLDFYRKRRRAYHFDPDSPLCAAPDPGELDRLMRHEFALAGCPPVPFGPVIDWRRENGYLEWHCQLCRQAFWLTLAEAWRRTGENRYIAELADQLKSWDAQVPPHYPAEGVVRAIDPGLRLTHWMRLFPVAVLAPAFDEATLLRFLTHVQGACEYLNAHGAEGYCPANHGVFEAMGVLQAGLYVPEFKAARRWRTEAIRCIGSRILSDVRPDGGQVEQSASYHAHMLDYFILFLHLLELAGETPPAKVRERVARMRDFLAALRMPDGRCAALGDTTPVFEADAILAKGTELPAAGQAGEPSDTDNRIFADSGLIVLRGNQSDRNARWLLFDTGPHGGWHGHYDLLHVLAGGYGRSFLVDPGCGRYDPQWRPLMRSTAMHNTVNVDFHDYLDEGALDTAAPSLGRLERVELDGTVKILHGWHEAYSTPRERIVVERQIRMVRGDYWIVADRVTASQLHEFASFWHFTPGELRAPDVFQGVTTTFPDANLAVIPLFGNARYNTIARWHVPGYPLDPPSPAWVAEGVGRDWLFAVALIPYPGERLPLRSFSTQAIEGGFSVRLNWESGVTDALSAAFEKVPGTPAPRLR